MGRSEFCPSKLMQMLGEMTSRNDRTIRIRFRNTYLTEDFLNLKIGDYLSFAEVYLPRGSMKTERQKRFMTPQDDSRNSIINKEDENDAELLAGNITNEILQGLSDNAKKQGLCRKIKWTALSPENNPFRISENCVKDIGSAREEGDKFTILLLFAIFQKHYDQCGIRERIHLYLSEKDSSWHPVDDLKNSHVYQSLKKLKLTHGYEGDYYRDWKKPLFLEENQRTGTSLGDAYVLPSYQEGRELKNDLMEYMERIIENEDHENQISLILGGPGAGKTTLFSRFLNKDESGHSLVDVDYDGDIPVCIYRGKKRVYLYRFNKIGSEVWKGLDGKSEATAKEVEKRLFSGTMGIEKASDLKDTILLLDGFDECPASRELRASLLSLFAENWGCYARIFITCRFHYISDTDNLSDKISCISLQPFNWDHIQEFICKYRKWNPKNEETKKLLQTYWQVMGKEDENNRSADNPSNIYGIPIILYMVLAMGDQITLRPDSTKAMIYDQIFRQDNGIYDRMIADKYYDSKTKGDESIRTFLKDSDKRKEFKTRLIEVSHHIAHYMFRNDCYQNARKKDIVDMYENEFAPFCDSNDKVVDLPKILSSGLFMIVDTPEKGNPLDSTIRFVHKSMYEYFVAEYIYSQIAVFMQDGQEPKFHKKLAALLRDHLVTPEIGEYLEQKLKDDKNADFEKMEAFSEKMLYLGIHYYDGDDIWKSQKESRPKKESLLQKESLSLKEMAEGREKIAAEERQVFENLLAILQLFRSAKEGKNVSNLLFHNCLYAKKSFPFYLRKGHFSGPGGTAFDLSYTDLSGLDLSHTDLSYYNLTGVNAKGTNFRHARLDFCNLTDTDLTDAAFTGAALWQTTPTANQLFDDPMRKIPWTEFEGYLSGHYELTKDSSYSPTGRFLGKYRLGKYPMDIRKSEEREELIYGDIYWDILEIRGNRALLISQKILDVVPYNEKYGKTNWEKCTLNRWLKNEFRNKARFEVEEEERFCRSLSEPHSNIDSDYQVDQGGASIDEFFLLSGQELVKYFGSTESTYSFGIDWEKSRTEDTTYAQKATGFWWLRSVGFSGGCAMIGDDGGDVLANGSYVCHGHVGVRPALWISLKS